MVHANGSLHMGCAWLGKYLVLVHAMWKYALVAWVHVLMWVLECMNVWVHVWVHGRGACACIDVCIGACLLGCICGCMAEHQYRSGSGEDVCAFILM